MYKIILHGRTFSLSEIDNFIEKSGGKLDVHTENALHVALEEPMDFDEIQQWREVLQCDVNLLPPGFDPAAVKLVVSDMDSTFISIECVDEIADYAGVKPQVSQVTEAAMRGELNFEQSLTERVALLKGLDESALQKVYDERLQLNPGAEAMLEGLKSRGIRFALVSGGFTFFTSRLQERLGLDYTLSNTLEIDNHRLTGMVVGDIVGAEAKANFLLEKCNELGITPQQTIAMGDGANDLTMMAQAGLGVAYKAKPKVQEAADCVLNHSGLDGLLDLLNVEN